MKAVKIVPLGDETLILRVPRVQRPWTLAEALNRTSLPGLIEAFASYDSVGLSYDPASFAMADLESWLDRWSPPGDLEGRRHLIPICYALGEDLSKVADRLGLTPSEVATLHAGAEYTCAAIGFQPGFPYLGPLPGPLCGEPRLAQPRVCVPPGSVGITGDQTGIYPAACPGGWALIGRTPLCLVDFSTGYFPIMAGDIVCFEPIDEGAYARMEGDRL